MNDFDPSDYSGDVSARKSLPTLMLLTAKVPEQHFGFVLEPDRAEASDFTIQEPWGLAKYTISVDKKRIPKDGISPKIITAEDGNPVADWARFVIPKRTPILAYQEVMPGKKRPVDYCYRNVNGQSELTEAGKNASDRTNQAYWKASRQVIYVVNEKNEPLHPSPLQMTTKTAFDTSFGIELRFFRDEINRCMVEVAKQKGVKLPGDRFNDNILALSVFAIRVGLKGNYLDNGTEGAMSCFIAERMSPTTDTAKIGKSEVIHRGKSKDIPIRLHYVHWQDLFISKHTEFGQQILSDHEAYKMWGEIATQQQSSPVQQPVYSDGYDDYDEDDGWSGRPNGRVDIQPPAYDLQPQYPVAPVAPVAVKPVVSSATFSKNEEMERSQLLEDTSELISSLGWSNESGQDYLFRNFGKRGRSLLTTEELRRFKKMLEGESATQFGYPA
jgi:hypothetical protein